MSKDNEIIAPTPKKSIDWEQRRYELILAMCGNGWVDKANIFNTANSIIEELKKSEGVD